MPNTETKTKQKLERTYTCSVCSTSYTTPRYSKTHYCTPSCRSKARNSKTAAKRIEKIPYSDNWLWIARECRRAGTVQILENVDLEKLFEVYNRRYKCYGWDADKKVSKFHLCHIAPVSGANSIGLLHHQNLFIGSSLPNLKHGDKCYKGAGLSISRLSLQPRWAVGKDESDKKVFAKIQKYLGSKLIDYAKAHPIKKANRFVIAERISKLENNTTALVDLRKMGTQALMQLEADLNDTIAYSIKLTAKRSVVVYIEELERFASYQSENSDDYQFVADACRIVAQWLASQKLQSGLCSVAATDCYNAFTFTPLRLRDGKDSGKLRDFVGFTAFATLQGAPVDRELITHTLRSYLEVISLDVKGSGLTAGYSDFTYITEAVEEFKQNAQKVKDALQVVGLLDGVTTHRMQEASREHSFFDQWQQDVNSSEFYDYPDDYYQDDGFVSPCIPSHKRTNYQPPIFVGF
ncbi:MAG: hypothetical protein VCA57_19025 [Pseudomonas sp.]|uniref:hypothetical protein n=1 Tax=Pseudomonas sp. TaxID=306 RepID=UPI00398195CB